MFTSAPGRSPVGATNPSTSSGALAAAAWTCATRLALTAPSSGYSIVNSREMLDWEQPNSSPATSWELLWRNRNSVNTTARYRPMTLGRPTDRAMPHPDPRRYRGDQVGYLVTLSGGGQRRILYMNTCDRAQGWTTSHCQDQDHPRLTVQNLTFVDGSSTGQTTDGGGGGAIFVRGGRLKVVNSRFLRNTCDRTGPDVGGAAIRVLSQSRGLPVYVVNSTFGGAKGQGGSCSNGGALSSIGVSWVVLNSVLTHNSAVGYGANPARSGTPGGGSGGAIYCDGNRFTVRIAGTRIEDNHAFEGGGAVFFVSNDRTGTMTIESSTLRRNPSDGFETRGYPGIYFLGARNPTVISSTIR